MAESFGPLAFRHAGGEAAANFPNRRRLGLLSTRAWFEVVIPNWTAGSCGREVVEGLCSVLEDETAIYSKRVIGRIGPFHPHEFRSLPDSVVTHCYSDLTSSVF